MFIILGGTFDPIHLGHMSIATKLYDMFKTPIVFLPTGIPPYKLKPSTLPDQRMAMLEIAIHNDARFQIDDTEIKRDKFCYTYKTLIEFRQKIGNAVPLFFVIGSDSLLTLDTWDNWQMLFNLTNFIIAKRSQYNEILISDKLRLEYDSRIINDVESFRTRSHGYIYLLEFDPIDISSTQIRSNIKNNLPFENLVPNGIAEYIKKHKLYQV